MATKANWSEDETFALNLRSINSICSLTVSGVQEVISRPFLLVKRDNAAESSGCSERSTVPDHLMFRRLSLISEVRLMSRYDFCSACCLARRAASSPVAKIKQAFTIDSNTV